MKSASIIDRLPPNLGGNKSALSHASLKSLILDATRLRLILLSLAMGLAGAAIMPVMSTHLAVNLHIEPMWIGVLFAANTLSGVLVSHWLAKQSDAGLSRIGIIRVCVSISFVASIGLGLAEQYWLLLITGMLMFGAVSPVQPQLFALAREQVGDADATLFQSLLRATFSLSWIIGPPLAYLLFARIGFLGLTLICALIFLLTRLNVASIQDAPLPAVRTEPQPTDSRLKWMILAIAATFASNNMYIVYMPIYSYDSLQLAAVVPGFLMGAAAGLEIPIMIGAGIFAGRWRLFSPLKLAAICGLVFYLGVYWSNSLVPLVLLQIFNGAFIGVMAGLGISVFQALMQGRMGMASTLYSNAIKVGSLVGALLGGAVAQWLSIQAVFGVCALMALVALLALVKASAGNRS